MPGVVNDRNGVGGQWCVYNEGHPGLVAPNRRAYALHIGVNWTDESWYGSTNNLLGCINDAETMRRITQAYGIPGTMLTNTFATSANLVREIRKAGRQRYAKTTSSSFSYSGHGAQVLDSNDDESLDIRQGTERRDLFVDASGAIDNLDEALVLHDRLFVDDELYTEFCRFPAGGLEC